MKENFHHAFCAPCIFAGSECSRKSQAAGDPLERRRAATGGEDPRPQNQREDGPDLQWWDVKPVFSTRPLWVLGYIAAHLYSLQLPRLPQHPASGAACRRARTPEAETLTRPGRRAPERRTCSSSWPWPWAKRRPSRYRPAADTLAAWPHRCLSPGASVTVLRRAAPHVCSHRRDTHLLHVRHLLLLSHLVMPDLPQKGSGALEDADIRYALTLSKEIQQKVRGQSVCLDHFPASPQFVCLSAGEPPAQISQSANHKCLSCPVLSLQIHLYRPTGMISIAQFFSYRYW